MKKVMVGLMVGILLTWSSTAYAEIPDISGLSFEELLELQAKVSDALYDQDKLVPLPFGEYVVGEDIAAGKYEIKTHNNDTDRSAQASAYTVYIYKSKQARSDLEKAKAEYTAARKDAEANQENGEATSYPTQISIYDYIEFMASPGSKEGVSIALTNGQFLVVDRVWDDNLELSIEKKTGAGLFMEEDSTEG